MIVLAAPPLDVLRHALVRRFASALTDGPGSDVVTEHPAEAAAVVMALLDPGGPWQDEAGGPGERTPGEGNAMALTEAQVRADERQRIINGLRAAAYRDDNPLVPSWALMLVAGLIADAAVNGQAPAPG